MSGSLRVAVIGGGWAGLAAAEHLMAGGCAVTLREAGRVLGGRARGVDSRGSGFDFLDNGQHLLVGAYHQCLALLARAGVAEETAFLRLPLTWHLADGIAFQAARLPAPWHLLYGIARGRGMGWRDKLALLRQMRALQHWHRHHHTDISVGQWLAEQGVSAFWRQQFWQPLVWGSLNTPLAQASCRRLAQVLADGAWRRRADSDMLIPRRDLGHSWVAPVQAYLQQNGVRIETGHRVRRIETANDGVWVDGDRFDKAVLAVAPYHLAALLPQAADWQAALSALEYVAITTVCLRYPQAVVLPQAMTGLATGTAQWLISRGALGGDEREVAAVVSLSAQYGPLSAEQWQQRVHADVLRICPGLPPPLAVRVMTEKRATIASRVDLPAWPLASLWRQGLYPAGDYLHPCYPATLEAAVQSGRAAAEACMQAGVLAKKPEMGAV